MSDEVKSDGVTKTGVLSGRGLLDRSWVAAKGATKYAVAVASGDEADDETVKVRRERCRACPSRRRVQVVGAIGESDWCGEPLVERFESVLPTCGCLLAGKTAVASESCPQGRWVAVTVKGAGHRPQTSEPKAKADEE